MKIYLDEELTKPIDELDLGVGKVGNSYQYKFYVHNNSPARLKNLSYKLYRIKKDELEEINELKLLASPSALEPNNTGVLKIEWTPSLEIKEALKAKIVINGEEWYEY